MAEYGLPDTAGFEAAEGTVAHDIAAHWLDYRAGIEHALALPSVGEVITIKTGRGSFAITVTEEMLAAVLEYVEWCEATPADRVYVETRVDFSRLTPIPNQGGTADHIAVSIDESGRGHLTVTDLKYGIGHMVYAEKNPQISAYALGVIFLLDWLYDFDKVTLRICQPRREHFDTWETTRDDLLKWAEWAKERLALTWNRDAPRSPSEEACKFCRARATCPAVLSIADALADDTFVDERDNMPVLVTSAGAKHTTQALMSADYEPPKPRIKAMGTAQLAKILRYRKYMEHTLQAMYDELVRRVIEGNEPMPEGWILAEGKKSRTVLRSKAIQILTDLEFSEDDLYERTERSAADLEAFLIKQGIRRRDALALVKRAVISNPGKPSLAVAGAGKRVAVDLADDTFEDETQANS